jgi:hypothetical protein
VILVASHGLFVKLESNPAIGTVVFTEMFHTNSRDLHQCIEINNKTRNQVACATIFKPQLEPIMALLAQVKRG